MTQLFTDSDLPQGMKKGPLSCIIPAYATLLSQQGYGEHSTHLQLRFLNDLDQWLNQQQLQVTDLSEPTIHRYMQSRLQRLRPRRDEASTLSRLVHILQAHGVLPNEAARSPVNPHQHIENDYDRYLSEERGLAVATRISYRSFIQKFLQPDQVQQVLSQCDRQTAQGRRDYAILLLLARLGLRACEIVSLTLDDIHWQTGEISIKGKGNRLALLPLPPDVGQAIAVYLETDRPICSTRRVFIRMRAPRRGFANSCAISTIVARTLKKAGIDSPHTGAHLFRHTLATQMLRQGAALADIALLLRHRSIDTTVLYAKVDLTALRTIAQPWPGGAK